MTTRLSPESERRQGAARFGAALSAAMRRRGLGNRRVGAAIGASTASISNYRLGENLPTLETAQLLATALDAPHLVRLVRAARERHCAVCGQVFLQAIGPKRYCSQACQRIRGQMVDGEPVRARAAIAERQLRVYQDAVGLFCAECEPEGLCRDGGCVLRPVSPLRLRRERTA